MVEVSVYGEPNLSVSQRLDGQGRISIPLLGDIQLAGMNVRKAESFLESRFIEEEYLKNPQVTVRVTGYSVRQFFIFRPARGRGAESHRDPGVSGLQPAEPPLRLVSFTRCSPAPRIADSFTRSRSRL